MHLILLNFAAIMIVILIVLLYFSVLMVFSRFTAHKSSNDTFYRANKRSPWYMVAFGMVGASISGVTFVSVPGMVIRQDMTYMQTCLGFILGYFAVAFILLPVYYKWNMTTIYSYLQLRLGHHSYKTGAWFFLLSKMTGAAVRFYVVCLIVSRVIGVGFFPTVLVMTALIWLYTRKGGIKTLVWTDMFQTACMFTALVLILCKVIDAQSLSIGEAISAIASNEHSRMFVFDDWLTRQNFWKQFLSGIFIVIVMTGLDQDMMQKNLTCKTLREAQKDMCTYGFAFVPANLLFMSLGVLLVMLAQQQGVPLPQNSDELLPMFAVTGKLGTSVVVFFTIGIVAASFSSADSALTAMTTSYCVDICEQAVNERLRKNVHVVMATVFMLIIILVYMVNSTSIIDAIYILCSYTYGPLLGLFAFALLTNRMPSDRFVPFIAIASPIICYLLNAVVSQIIGYHFGYELLMLNGLLTFIGLWASGSKKKLLPNASGKTG